MHIVCLHEKIPMWHEKSWNLPAPSSTGSRNSLIKLGFKFWTEIRTLGRLSNSMKPKQTLKRIAMEAAHFATFYDSKPAILGTAHQSTTQL